MTTPATVDRTACTATRHGDEWAYSKYGCRCPDGRTAWATYNRERRRGTNIARLVNVAPTTTRLRILAALGYDWRTLTRAAAYSHPRQITDLAFANYPSVQRRTHNHIAAVFAGLVAQPAPCGYAAARAIDNAWRAGWGVVDLEVVNRALHGHRPDITPLERAAVIHIGHSRGLTVAALMEAARASHDTVTRSLGLTRTIARRAAA